MASIRLYAHKGMVSAHLVAGGTNRPNADSVFLLQQPYIGSEILSSGGTAVASDAANAPTGTKLLSVQLPPNVSIHYEVTREGQQLRDATTSSPIMRNDSILDFAKGDRLSVLDASE